MDKKEKIEILQKKIRELKLAVEGLNREIEMDELLDEVTSMTEFNKITLENSYAKIEKYTCKLNELALEEEV